MNKYNKTKDCIGFKSLEDAVHPFKGAGTYNCKDCMYFSSRNCGMDVADNITPDMEIFY